MGLKIIGAGFGRTGTLSLKYALEKLGYMKTYHMMELIQNPSQVVYWEQLENGQEPDWEDLFKGFEASVDFPGCLYYKQMMKKYPDAKVILTVRDADRWWQSVHDTIYQQTPVLVRAILKVIGIFKPKIKYMVRVFKYARGTVWNRFFNDRFMDKEYAKSVFLKFNEEVKLYVPKEKLLVFEVKDGWEPLCKFLNVAVPNEPFPKVNDTEEFNDRRKFFKKKKRE